MTVALHPEPGRGLAKRVKDPGGGVSGKVLKQVESFGTTWYFVRLGDADGWVMEAFVEFRK